MDELQPGGGGDAARLGDQRGIGRAVMVLRLDEMPAVGEEAPSPYHHTACISPSVPTISPPQNAISPAVSWQTRQTSCALLAWLTGQRSAGCA